MKKWKITALLLLLYFNIIACPKQVLADGNGFELPEDVIAAYVEGMQAQDLEQMLSAFAVETYVDHYQAEALIEQMGAYNQARYFPDTSDYARGLNIEWRKGQLYLDIQQQYLILTESKAKDGTPAWLKDYDDDARRLIQDIFAEDDSVFLDNIELKGFLQIDKSDIYVKESVQREREAEAMFGGGEEVRSVAAWLQIAEADYLMIMDVICYDGRWYGLDPGGTFANANEVWYGFSSFQNLTYEQQLELLSCPVVELEASGE